MVSVDVPTIGWDIYPSEEPKPCVWCECMSGERADAPFRPDLGRVPLHLHCGGQILIAYARFEHGAVLDERTITRLSGYRARLLTAG